MGDIYVANLENAMLDMSVPNTDVVKQAEKKISFIIKTKDCVPAMVHLLRFSRSPAVRQLCAVLLRIRICSFWKQLPQDTRLQIKNIILEAVALEPIRIVSLNATYVVAAICNEEAEAEDIKWQELFPFIYRLATSPSPKDQELSMMCFYALTEAVGTMLQPHFRELRDLYVSLLTNATDNAVRKAALKACGALIEYLSDAEDVLLFRELIPLLIGGLEANLSDETIAVYIIEVFQTLVKSPAPIINKYVSQLVAVLLKGLGATDFCIKEVSAMTLCDLIEFKARVITKQKLLDSILHATIEQGIPLDFPHFQSVVATQEGADEDDHDDSSQGLGRLLILAISTHVAPRHTSNTILQAGLSRMSRAASPSTQWTGICLITHSLEGLAEVYREPKIVESILNHVVPFVHSSSSSMLQVAALFCLSEMVQSLSPEINVFFPSLLPLAVNAMNAPSPAVQAAACDLVELICDDLEDTDILSPLLNNLVTNLLQQSQFGIRLEMRCTALSTLASVAATTSEDFLPYFDTTCRVVCHLASLTDEPLLQVRGYAMAVLGSLALAVSSLDSNPFEPLLADVLAYASKGLEFGDMELNRLTYQMVGNLADAFEDKTDSMLNSLVALTIHGMDLDDNVEVNVKDRDGTSIPKSITEVFVDEEEQEDVYQPGVKYELLFRMEVIEAKRAALYSIGRIAANVTSLGQHSETLFQSVFQATGHSNEDIRSIAVETLADIVLSFEVPHPLNEASKVELERWGQQCLREIDTSQRWLPGLPPRVALPVGLNKILVTVVVPALLEIISDDTVGSVVVAALRAIEKFIRYLGPAVLVESLDRLMELLLEFLSEQGSCQNQYEDEDEEEDDADVALLDAVCDLLGMLSHACGPSFQPCVPVVFRILAGRIKHSREQVSILGAFAEILVGMGGLSSQVVSELLPLATEFMSSGNLITSRNATYLAGVLVMHADHQHPVSPFLHQLEVILSGVPELDKQIKAFKGGVLPVTLTDAQACVDNAIGALAKVIIANAVDRKQLANIFVGYLPLRFDFSENLSVVLALTILAEESLLDESLPRVVSIVIEMLNEVSSEGLAKKKILAFLQSVDSCILNQALEGRDLSSLL